MLTNEKKTITCRIVSCFWMPFVSGHTGAWRCCMARELDNARLCVRRKRCTKSVSAVLVMFGKGLVWGQPAGRWNGRSRNVRYSCLSGPPCQERWNRPAGETCGRWLKMKVISIFSPDSCGHVCFDAILLRKIINRIDRINRRIVMLSSRSGYDGRRGHVRYQRSVNTGLFRVTVSFGGSFDCPKQDSQVSVNRKWQFGSNFLTFCIDYFILS